eukprot:6065193-Pleurochrysis_carterae.AAC.3
MAASTCFRIAGTFASLFSCFSFAIAAAAAVLTLFEELSSEADSRACSHASIDLRRQTAASAPKRCVTCRSNASCSAQTWLSRAATSAQQGRWSPCDSFRAASSSRAGGRGCEVRRCTRSVSALTSVSRRLTASTALSSGDSPAAVASLSAERKASMLTGRAVRLFCSRDCASRRICITFVNFASPFCITASSLASNRLASSSAAARSASSAGSRSLFAHMASSFANASNRACRACCAAVASASNSRPSCFAIRVVE